MFNKLKSKIISKLDIDGSIKKFTIKDRYDIMWESIKYKQNKR